MAHQVAGGQILRPSAQIAVQPVHLAGCAGKQHWSLVQPAPHLPKDALQIALDVLGAPQAPQLLLAEAGGVPQMLAAVKGGAKDHAAAFQDILRQQGEHAARGGVSSDLIVSIPGREYSGHGALRPLPQDGAHRRAVPAPHTGRSVDHRIGKALPVPLHGDGVLGTAAGAGRAAGAVGVVRQMGQGPFLCLDRRLLRCMGPVLQGAAQIVQGQLPLPAEPLPHRRPVDGRRQVRGISLADDPLPQSQAAQQAEGPGTLRRSHLCRCHRRKEGLLELDGEHRSVEGVGAHIGGIPEQTQKLRRTGAENAAGLGVDLLAYAAQLHHRQPRLLRQAADIGCQGVGAADAIAEDIAPARASVPGRGRPIRSLQQQRGIQYHRHVLPGDVPDNALPLPLPDGQVGEGLQIGPQLLLHAVRDAGDAEGWGIGDLSLVGEGPEEHRVEPAVGEDLRVPNLVTAGEQHIVGQLRLPQLLQALVAAAGNVQILPGKCLKPLVSGLQRAIVQGGVGVMGGASQAGGPLEQGVVLVHVVVDDLAFAPQGRHRPLRGVSLQHGAVVMDMVKGQQSCFHQVSSFPQSGYPAGRVTVCPEWRRRPGVPEGRPPPPSPPHPPRRTPWRSGGSPPLSARR